MRVLKLEFKKVLKSRRTWILIVLSLFFSVVFAYLPITFESVSIYDETGNKVGVLKGMEAIQYYKTAQKDITGTITPTVIRHAVEEYQSCLQEYNVEQYWELPNDVVHNRILPIYKLIPKVSEAFADSKTGMAPSVMDIEAERTADFYSVCEQRLVSLMEMEQKDSKAAQKIALDMYQNVEKPYYFYPGYSTNATDYELLLAMLLMLFGTVITAPIFSSDYQTGADDILRCTKHGRIRLGVSKAVTAIGISGILFTVCMTIYVLLSNSFFGWECTRTSMQIMYSITGLADWNMGKLQWMILLAGLMTVIATVCFTLFFSSKCRNVVSSLAIGLIMCFAPVFIYMLSPAWFKAGSWLRCILPSGGLGLMSSFCYGAIGYEFLTLGNFAIWVPYAMVVFAAADMVIFAVLAVYSYISHKAG